MSEIQPGTRVRITWNPEFPDEAQVGTVVGRSKLGGKKLRGAWEVRFDDGSGAFFRDGAPHVQVVDEMGGAGSGGGNTSANITGFQLPLGVRRKRVREAMELHGLSETHAAVFLRGAGEDAREQFLEAIDLMAYEQAAAMVAEQVIREAVRQKIREVVRKKKGGGGYVLYAPNKGKKHQSKPLGTFTTKLAAKRAELARFPPKDPKKLQRLRRQVTRLMKDPKARAEAEKKAQKQSGTDSSALAPARSVKREGLDRVIMTEAVIRSVREGLFREEAPASEWDKYIAKISDKAIRGDRGFRRLQKKLELATHGALAKAVRIIQKQLGPDARVRAAAKAGATEGGQPYIPFTIETADASVGPIFLYVENGRPAIEMSDEAKNGLTKVQPEVAKAIRAALAVSGDSLNEVEDVSTAVGERDAYLGRLERQIDRMIAGMTPLQVSLLKNLLVKKYRGSK